MSASVKGTGLRFKEDERDSLYLLRHLTPEVFRAGPRRTRRHPMFRLPLDQGATGTCVEHGWLTWGWAGPIVQRRKLLALRQYDVYRRIVQIDEWADNDWEATAPAHQLQGGTSVRAGAKVMCELGFLSTFGWALTADEVIDWIVGVGPVVVGTEWWPDWRPTRATRPTVLRIPPGGARPDSGHCYTFTGWDERRGLLESPNSWGYGGEIRMEPETLDQLLRRRGQACTAVEVRAA